MSRFVKRDHHFSQCGPAVTLSASKSNVGKADRDAMVVLISDNAYPLVRSSPDVVSLCLITIFDIKTFLCLSLFCRVI